jgi:hypothetical protein
MIFSELVLMCAGPSSWIAESMSALLRPQTFGRVVKLWIGL